MPINPRLFAANFELFGVFQTKTAATEKGVICLIPNSVIDSIKQRCDIESVISSYVTLKQTGYHLKGLCPFHSEKTPSFVVYTDNQSFYCFGCGAGGDVVNFVMRTENLDYVSAVESLAKRAGIALPMDGDYKSGERGVSRQRVLQMNLEAAKFYRSMLHDDNIGAPGRAYLMSRGLTSAIVGRFGLGYSPPSGKMMLNHLRSLGFKDEEIHTAYFAGKNERGYYDYFRGRVMFPIIDVSGNVVAFGGRVLDDAKPKYLNTSNTPAFIKGKTLFALNYAKNYCTEHLILCEGYLDVISMHQAGFQSAVATLGTAITSDHARIIKKYTSKVILSYDSDEAGVAAANKAIGILEAAGVDAKVLKLEGAKDPDEFIKKFGAAKFDDLLKGSRSKFDYFLENISSKYNFDKDEEKIRALNEVCRHIATIYSNIERDIYIAKVAKLFEVNAESVQNDVDRQRRRAAKENDRRRKDELIKVTSGLGDRVNPDFAGQPKAAKTEEAVLGMLMLHGELGAVSVDGVPLAEADMPTALGKRLFAFLSECRAEGADAFSFGAMSETFTQEEISRATHMMVQRRGLSATADTYTAYVRALRGENEKNAVKDTMSLGDILKMKRNQK